MRGQLILDHVKPGLAPAQVKKVAVRYVAKPTFGTDLLLGVEVDAIGTEQLGRI